MDITPQVVNELRDLYLNYRGLYETVQTDLREGVKQATREWLDEHSAYLDQVLKIAIEQAVSSMVRRWFEANTLAVANAAMRAARPQE
jgi:hypothetical protein